MEIKFENHSLILIFLIKKSENCDNINKDQQNKGSLTNLISKKIVIFTSQFNLEIWILCKKLKCHNLISN